MTKIIVENGLEYTASNHRLRYTPELHYNHKKNWTRNDLLYLCGMWGETQVRNIALGLGRTEGVCQTMICKLRREGTFESYKKEYKAR